MWVRNLFQEIQLHVESWEQEINAMKELQRLQPLHHYVSAQHSRSKQGNYTSKWCDNQRTSMIPAFHIRESLYMWDSRIFCQYWVIYVEYCRAKLNKTSVWLLLSWPCINLSERHAENQCLRWGGGGWILGGWYLTDMNDRNQVTSGVILADMVTLYNRIDSMTFDSCVHARMLFVSLERAMADYLLIWLMQFN